MGFRRWPVPVIDTVGDLAAFLDLEVGALEWFADVRGLERVVARRGLRHYRYAQVPRASGPPRVLEAPKPRLKALQRRLLHEMLDWIPVHPAAHGFVGGRSARTHAAAHVGRRVVVRVDLEDFFAGVTAARVFGIFRACRLPGGRRARAHRAVHERRAARASPSRATGGSRAGWRRRTCRRARRPRPRWPTSPRSRSTAA